MDMLGKTNVALLSGCFCLCLSLWPCDSGETTLSGNEMDLMPMGDPCGLAFGDACDAATTRRLKPAPSRPENAENADPTTAPAPADSPAEVDAEEDEA